MTNPFLDSILNQLVSLTGLPADELRSIVQGPPDVKKGDYAFPCFVLAKKERKNPAELASELAGEFQPDAYIERAEPAGPYLNFFVHRKACIEHVLGCIHEQGEDFGNLNAGEGNTIVIDYSSPNIAKPLGVHHLCSTMIGNSLYRIFKALGYRVVGVNHLGDWGTQFGVLLGAYKRWGDSLSEKTVNGLVELYVRYSDEMKEDEALREEAREWFRKLENGDETARALWKEFREISLDEFKRIYERLGVQFDSFAGESFYNERIDATVERIQEAGLATISQDALVVDLEDYDMPPCILRKSDDASLYATRDLAGIQYRKETYDFEKVLYVVGADQRLHFRQLFKVMELLGDEVAAKCFHVDFGLVLFLDPEAGGWAKGSTRKGNLELLEDVLDRAAELALQIIEENEKKMDFVASKEEIAEAVAIAAVCFGILCKSRQKDVKFDWDEILSFRGKTGPYLQYAHARQASILRKYGKKVTGEVDLGRLDDPEEFELAMWLSVFPRAVEKAAAEFEPSCIANYLLDLAAVYSRYSQDSVRHKILSDDEELTAARVLLVSCVRTVLQKGLYLLGIIAPEQM